MNKFGVKTHALNIMAPLASLNILYSGMPNTVGCEHCESANGADKKDWCCIKHNPSMFYVEFLNAWQHVQNTWSKERRKALIFRAITNYLRNSIQKGCVFYENGCSIHSKRPLACRMYGITPSEVWDNRVDTLKKKYGDQLEITTQCNLIKTDDGRQSVSAEEDDKWFNHAKDCERRLGVSKDAINRHDMPGGTYRTFHDHLLMELFPIDALETLTKYRLSGPSETDIEKSVTEIINRL